MNGGKFLDEGIDQRALHWDGNWKTAGVSKDTQGRCRVVLNRAVARSGTDGLLLGENCYSFYGANLANGASRLAGVMLHASPVATKIIIETVMEDRHEAYRRP